MAVAEIPKEIAIKIARVINSSSLIMVTVSTKVSCATSKSMSAIVAECWSGVDWCSHGSGMGNGGGMGSGSDSLHNSIETVRIVSNILYNADSTVRFDDGVLTLDNIAVTVFGLALDIAGVTVRHTVVVGITRMSLYKKIVYYIYNIYVMT